MRLPLFAVALALLSTLPSAQSLAPPSPPTANKIHAEKEVNGVSLVDDYGWLRMKNNPEVLSYLEAENAYAEQLTADQKPFAERLYQETLSHMKQNDISVPYRKHGYWYYSRTERGKQYTVLCRKKGSVDAPEEVLLDVNELARGEKFMSLGSFEISDDSNLLAYTTDNVGFRQYKLHIKDLRTGRLRGDTALHVDDVAWAADNKTVFYTTEDPLTKRADKVHRHILGANSRTDPVIFHEKDQRYVVGLDRTRDGKYIELTSGSHVSSEVRFLSANLPNSRWKVIQPRAEGVQYHVDEGNDLFYIRVNDTSRSFRVMTTSVATPDKKHWKELIAARDDTPIDDVEVFKDFYVTTERINGLETLRIVGLKNHTSQAIEFPEAAYSASPTSNEEFDTHNFRYVYSSPVTPESIFEYDTLTGTSHLLKQEDVPGYDKSKYTVERVLVPAKDNTQIPVTVVYRKDKFKRGENPLFIYGYGSYGVSVDDDFSVNDIPLLDRGVIGLPDLLNQVHC